MYSVIIPMYNSSQTIVSVLDSIKGQTRIDLIDEIIVIDDDSTDDSKDVVNKYKKTNPDLPIRLIHQRNGGPSTARNLGMKEAKGEWIALLDSDDLWIPQKIEIQTRCIDNNPNILFLGGLTKNGGIRFLLRSYNHLINVTAFQLVIKSFPQPSTVVFLKSAQREIGYFDEKMKYAEDINFFQKFLIKYHNYYIMPVKVAEQGISKSYHGEKGLSSNIYQMHLGRLKNTKEIYLAGEIGILFFLLMQIFNWIKFLRRLILVELEKKKNDISRNGNI